MMEKELPECCIETKVQELCKQIRGINYGKGDANSTAYEGSILVLRGGNVQDGKIEINKGDDVYVDESLVKEE